MPMSYTAATAMSLKAREVLRVAQVCTNSCERDESSPQGKSVLRGQTGTLLRYTLMHDLA